MWAQHLVLQASLGTDRGSQDEQNHTGHSNGSFHTNSLHLKENYDKKPLRFETDVEFSLFPPFDKYFVATRSGELTIT